MNILICHTEVIGLEKIIIQGILNPDDWRGLKKLLGFDNKYDKQVTTLVKKKIQFEQSLRITNWVRPSDTLTATSPEIHINLKEDYLLENAILQTFQMILSLKVLL